MATGNFKVKNCAPKNESGFVDNADLKCSNLGIQTGIRRFHE